MSADLHPDPSVPPAVDGTAPEVGPRPTPTSSSGPPARHVEVRNLRGGQMIEMDVRGEWSADELEDRLLRFVSVRQPAALVLDIEARDGVLEPLLARARAAIEDLGGTLTVSMTSVAASDPPSGVAPGSAPADRGRPTGAPDGS